MIVSNEKKPKHTILAYLCVLKSLHLMSPIFKHGLEENFHVYYIKHEVILQ